MTIGFLVSLGVGIEVIGRFCSSAAIEGGNTSLSRSLDRRKICVDPPPVIILTGQTHGMIDRLLNLFGLESPKIKFT